MMEEFEIQASSKVIRGDFCYEYERRCEHCYNQLRDTVMLLVGIQDCSWSREKCSTGEGGEISRSNSICLCNSMTRNLEAPVPIEASCGRFGNWTLSK